MRFTSPIATNAFQEVNFYVFSFYYTSKNQKMDESLTSWTIVC